MEIKFILKIIIFGFLVASAQAADNWPTIFEKTHPIQTELSTQFYKDIPVVPGAPGNVILVNFELMKKLGLMSITDENKLSAEISEKILQGFNIRVAKEGEAPTGKAIATYYATIPQDEGMGALCGLRKSTLMEKPMIFRQKAPGILGLVIRNLPDTLMASLMWLMHSKNIMQVKSCTVPAFQMLLEF